MKIRYLGGGREVGRSAIMVDTGVQHVFDYGTNVQTGEIPIAPPPETKYIFLSHAHLDHSGGLPLLYSTGFKGMTFMTATTLNLSELLLEDSLSVQKKKGLDPQFTMADISRTIWSTKIARLGKPINIQGGQVTFFDAGHIPGSASVLLESNGKRILYTGDINFMNTQLMGPAYDEFEDIDVLITECTYTYKNHPPREETAENLRRRVTETVHRGGVALLPAFAVGRTQEILLILSSLGLPITMDGMGVEATQKILMDKETLVSPGKLSKAFEQAHKIKRNNQRFTAIKKPGIIITTSGMLQGGPASYYIDKLHERKECSMTLLGYQVEGTPGRLLLETGRYVNEGIDVDPEMDIKFFDFSAHASRDALVRLIDKVSAEKVLLFHGDHAPEFAKDLQSKGIDAEAPRNGDVVQI